MKGIPQHDELRPITALFADVVGSTALGEHLAPDEVKSLIGECVTRMSHAVEEFGGVVQAYQGDGICAYFGVPFAHEDDPLRAASAALRIRAVVAEYAAEVASTWGITTLAVRVGMNSGPAAVGMVGAADRQTVALGDTTNVAARLQAAAEPGGILVGEITAGRLADSFELESAGSIAVKGRKEPVNAWHLGSARATDRERPDVPLFGRTKEIGQLESAVADLDAGRGAVMVVVGETGIGKTRMLAELHRIAKERVDWLEGHAASYGASKPYAPLLTALRGWLQVSDADPALMVRMRLRGRLAGLESEVVALLAHLLGVRAPSDANPIADMPPSDVAEHLDAAFEAWVEWLAQRRPLVVALEDVNWEDAASARLTGRLFELTDRLPVMIVLTLRPDPDSEGWRLRTRALTEYAHRLVAIELHPLSSEESAALVDARTGPAQMDPSSRAEVVALAEGNPLFLQEILSSLDASGALERRRTWTLSVPMRSVLSPTLEALLISRLDRLDAGPRELAQLAAVIGRSFSRRVLELAAGRPIDEDLRGLLRARVIREEARLPDVRLAFQHGLFQEASLSTLTSARRADLNLRVARALETTNPETIEERLEELAYHFGRGGDLPSALAYLQRAAERSMSLGAIEQAGRTWLRAMRVANQLGDVHIADEIRERMASVISSRDMQQGAP